jgi:riboflavin transporter FmnP
MSALAMSVIVALLEMVTVSDSGILGAIMNTVTSASFTCTAAFVYSKRRDIQGAVTGLALACVVATAAALLWNYAIIPLYVPGVTRDTVAAVMLPALIPFNLIKTSLNAVLALLVYKRVSAALRAAGLYTEPESGNATKFFHTAVMIVSAIIAVALLVLLYVIGSGD